MSHLRLIRGLCPLALALAGVVLTASVAAASAPPSASEPPSASDAPTTPPTQLTVGGTGLALVPAGEPGTVSLAAVGAFDGFAIPYVVRNDTDATVSDVVVRVVAHSVAGDLLGLIETQSNHATKPTTLQPGDVGIGMAFASIELPADVVFEYSVTFAEGANGRTVDLNISESAWQVDHLVGIAHNPTARELGTSYMGVLCMDDDGTPVAYEPFELDGPIAPQADAIFQATSLWSADDCANHLVAGYSN